MSGRPVRAGTYRHRVILQKPVETEGDYGGTEPGYTAVATVWARVTPSAGKENYQARQVMSEISHEVRIRYRRDVSARWRLSFRGRTLMIESAINVEEANRELLLECRETD